MKKVIHKPQVVTCGLCDRFIIIYSSLKSLYTNTPVIYIPRRDQISNGQGWRGLFVMSNRLPEEGVDQVMSGPCAISQHIVPS